MDNPLIQSLIDVQAVKSGEFMLRSGARSDLYVDVRVAVLHYWSADIVCQSMADVIMDRARILKPEHGEGEDGKIVLIGEGVGVHALIGGMVALDWSCRFRGALIRKEPKDHGLGKKIEGPEIMPDDLLVLIQDVMTTQGGSTLEAAKTVIEQLGRAPDLIVCLIDRRPEVDPAGMFPVLNIQAPAKNFTPVVGSETDLPSTQDMPVVYSIPIVCLVDVQTIRQYLKERR